MVSYRRVAAVLLVLGAALLANPLYLGPVLDATTGPSKVPTVYGADPVDPNSTAGRERIVDAFVPGLAFYTKRLEYVDEAYRAPNATQQVIHEAVRNGSASVPNDDVRADLRQIRREHHYVRVPETVVADDRESHVTNESNRTHEVPPTYRIRIVDRANGTVLRASRANQSALFDAVMDRYLVRYDSLNESQQRTFDRIRNESTGEDAWGYRPYSNESFHERLPAIVLKDGTYYHVHATGHVDDFGPGFFYFLVLTGAGAVATLLGLLVALGGYLWSRRQASAGDGEGEK